MRYESRGSYIVTLPREYPSRVQYRGTCRDEREAARRVRQAKRKKEKDEAKLKKLVESIKDW